MDCYVFKFKNRNLDDISNKCLSEIYNGDGPKFDLHLISSDKTVINAHTLVMAMFSEFIQDYLNEFKPTKNKICVPLQDLSTFVLRLVVDLIYNGQIMVGAEVMPHIRSALRTLKIKDVFVQSPSDQQTSTTTPTTPSPKPTKTAASVSNRPMSNLMAAKSVSASVPNVQQVSSGRAYKRELSANSIQYGNGQPAKRQRAQSVFIDSSSENPLPVDIMKRMGSVTINRTKASVSKNISMTQVNQGMNVHGDDDMDLDF